MILERFDSTGSRVAVEGGVLGGGGSINAGVSMGGVWRPRKGQGREMGGKEPASVCHCSQDQDLSLFFHPFLAGT